MKRLRLIGVVAVCLFITACSSETGRVRSKPGGAVISGNGSYARRNLIHQNTVVRINVTAQRITPNQPAVGMAVVEQFKWSGSGFIVSSEGYIVTNEHVVSTSKKEGSLENPSISVTVDAGSPMEHLYPAEVAAADPAMDLAVLKLTGTFGKLPVAQLGLNKDAVLGKSVKVMGYPGGGPYKETSGKVTKILYPGDSEIPLGAIVSDADVEPGYSGGPLVSGEGVVLGVTVKSLPEKRVEQFKKETSETMQSLNDVFQKIDRELREKAKRESQDPNTQAMSEVMIMGFQKAKENIIRGRIQAIAEAQPACHAIPVDSVSLMLRKWGIPFEGAPSPSK